MAVERFTKALRSPGVQARVTRLLIRNGMVKASDGHENY